MHISIHMPLRSYNFYLHVTGDTYILFNKQSKGNKRELLQFGVPIFGHREEDATGNNETGEITPIANG